ncbi:zinc-dependent alcohol dehydrogenase family protein [Mycolicibacterium parafortuitum]|uniref:enoyl-[acyl-carrier-protein] reductase n=1 Tax=Mycolicibacterium parafortuitum TaxID=39692 RepID=A0A375YDB1_MYCPF|nr:zinc-dependent alcohol dehydrogenase family protein [Mycolicibacterium parafortuitum]ORB31072.1 trans-2-enoyl-CoA reductase [Mycolicibacterium parafortuitum]SRX79103.1 zinc-binding dehydrogenase oxidoreductase [Myxococcus xanthus DK 1622] [Mycolicibacterium parafortuitum]
MKHLVLTRFGDPAESVHLADDPEPTPGPGEVLVRVEAAAINPSDLLLMQGKYLARPPLPAPVGAEGVGVVERAGSDADRGLLGKRVIVLPTYEYGTWAQKIVVPAHNVVEVPDADPLQLGMLSINPVTAHLLLDGVAEVGVGDWVGQTAANSAVGRLVIALARQRGYKTLNVVRRTDAAEDLRQAGGDTVLVSGPDLAGDVTRELGDEKLALVLDPLGGPTASALIAALKFRGTAVVYGSLIGAPSGVSPADLYAREVRYTGFWLGNWYSTAPRREIRSTLAYLARLVADGALSVPVEATYPLADYRKAFDHADAGGRGGKVLFTFD